MKESEKTELAASGISVPEQDELDVLLEDIAQRERDAIAEASEKKGQEKATAEDIRNQALERKGNPGEAVMRLSSLCRRRLNQTRHSEKKS